MPSRGDSKALTRIHGRQTVFSNSEKGSGTNRQKSKLRSQGTVASTGSAPQADAGKEDIKDALEGEKAIDPPHEPMAAQQEDCRHPKTMTISSQTEEAFDSPLSRSLATMFSPFKEITAVSQFPTDSPAQNTSLDVSPELRQQVVDLMKDVKTLQTNIYSTFGLDEQTPTSEQKLPEKDANEEESGKESPKSSIAYPSSVFNLPSPDAKTLHRYFPNLSSSSSSSSASSQVKKRLEAINEYIQKFRKVLGEVEERQRILDDNIHLAKHRHSRQELHSILNLMTSDPSAFTENLHIKQLVDGCISSVQAEILNTVSEQLSQEQQRMPVSQGTVSRTHKEDSKVNSKTATNQTKKTSRTDKKPQVASTLTSRLRAARNSNNKEIKTQNKKPSSKSLGKTEPKDEKSKGEWPTLEVPDDDSIFDDVASIEWDQPTQNVLPPLEPAQQQYVNIIYGNLMNIRRMKTEAFYDPPPTNPLPVKGRGDSANLISAIPLKPVCFQPDENKTVLQTDSVRRDFRGITAIPLSFRRPASAPENSKNRLESKSPTGTVKRKAASAPPSQKQNSEKDSASKADSMEDETEDSAVEGTDNVPLREENEEPTETPPKEEIQQPTFSPKSPSKAVSFNIPKADGSSTDVSDDYSSQFDESTSVSFEKEERNGEEGTDKNGSVIPSATDDKEPPADPQSTQIRTGILLGLRKHPHSKKLISETSLNAGLYQYGTLLKIPPKIPPSLSPQRKTRRNKTPRNTTDTQNITQLRVHHELNKSRSLIEKCSHLLGIDIADSTLKSPHCSPTQTPEDIQNEEISEEQISAHMEQTSKNDIAITVENIADEMSKRKQLRNTALFSDGEDEFVLPGMSPVTVPYHGVPYPPANVPPYPQVAIPTLRSSILPKEMKSTEQMLRIARSWIEQELLARALSLSDSENKPSSSQYNANRNSPLVSLLGKEGLKVFVDAGQPVDETLIQNLVKEIISEEAVKLVQQQRLNAGCGTTPVFKDKNEDQVERLHKPIEVESTSTQTAEMNEDKKAPVIMVETPVPTPVPSPRASPEPEVPALSPISTPSSSKESSDVEDKQSNEDVASNKPFNHQPGNNFMVSNNNINVDSDVKIETPQPTPPTSPSDHFHLQPTPPPSEEDQNILPSSSSPEMVILPDRTLKEEATQTSLLELEELDIYPDRQRRSPEPNPLPSAKSTSNEKATQQLDPRNDPDTSATNTSSVSEITDMTISEGEWWPANINYEHPLLPFQNYTGPVRQRKEDAEQKASAVSGVSMDNTLLDADDLDQEPVSEGEVRLPFSSSRNAFLAHLMKLQEKHMKENNDNESTMKTENSSYRSPGEVSASLLPFPRSVLQPGISADPAEDYDLISEGEDLQAVSRVPSAPSIQLKHQRKEKKSKEERHVSFPENLNQDFHVEHPPSDRDGANTHPFGPDLQPAEPGLNPSQEMEDANFSSRRHPDTLISGRRFSSSEDNRLISANKDFKSSFSTPSIQIVGPLRSAFLLSHDIGQPLNPEHRLSQFSIPHLFPHGFHSAMPRTSTRPFLVTHQSERDLSYIPGLRRDLSVRDPRKSYDHTSKLQRTSSSSSIHTKHISLEDAQPSTSKKRETSRDLGSPGEVRSISKSSAASSQSEHALRQSSDSHNLSTASSADEFHNESGRSTEDFEQQYDIVTTDFHPRSSQSLDSVESGEIDLYMTAQGYIDDSENITSENSQEVDNKQRCAILTESATRKNTKSEWDRFREPSSSNEEIDLYQLKKQSNDRSLSMIPSYNQLDSSRESAVTRSSEPDDELENRAIQMSESSKDELGKISEDADPSISSELSEGEIRLS